MTKDHHSLLMNPVLAEVAAERQQQDAKWGEQDHPDGTPRSWTFQYGWEVDVVAKWQRAKVQAQSERGATNWRDVLLEEVAGAFAEDEPANLRAELVQVAAVAVAWIEAIDRRQP